MSTWNLFYACEIGDIARVRRVVADGVDVRKVVSKNWDKESLLHCACRNGHLPLAKYLIEDLKCSPTCTDTGGRTPLHRACWNGHLPLAKYLIEDVKCSPTCTDTNGWTSLHHACRNGHLPLAKYLIEDLKCSPTCTNTSERTPLHYACRVLISTVNKSTDELPLVFFNNCFADEDFNNELVWKVARYTSAAPGFFAECDNYIDGGVKANNPTAFGITEIQDYLSKQGSSAAKLSCVVSLRCGIYPPEPLGNTDISNALTLSKFGKLPRCLWQLFSLMKSTIGSSDEISRHCETICKQQCIDYFRFSPKIGEEVGMTEKDNRKLCEIIIKAKQLFRENPEQVEKMIEQLGCKVKEDNLCYI